jgi:hypothetical protein
MQDDVLPVESQVSPERRVRQSSAARHLLARHVLSYGILLLMLARTRTGSLYNFPYAGTNRTI